MQVSDAAVALKNAGRLELDLLGRETLEQPPALAEEDGDDVELELVKDAGGERELRGAGAVDEDVPVSGGLPRPAIAVATSSTNVISGHCRASSGGSSRLRMKIGTPSWWSPLQ